MNKTKGIPRSSWRKSLEDAFSQSNLLGAIGEGVLEADDTVINKGIRGRRGKCRKWKNGVLNFSKLGTLCWSVSVYVCVHVHMHLGECT